MKNGLETKNVLFISANNEVPNPDNFVKNSEICIGSWCIFSILRDKKPQLKVGFVLELKYLDGKTFKEKEFSKSYAPVESDDKRIGVLCSFYSYNNSGVLSSFATDEHEYITADVLLLAFDIT